MAILSFFSQCQLIHLLRYNRTIAILGCALSRSATTLLSCAAVGGIIFMAFTMGAYLLFFELQPYSTIWTCLASQVSAFLGKFNFTQLVAAYGTLAGTYLLIYLLIMIVVIMNIFISMLNEFLAKVKDDSFLNNQDFRVVDHFLETLKTVVAGKFNSNKNQIPSGKSSCWMLLNMFLFLPPVWGFEGRCTIGRYSKLA